MPDSGTARAAHLRSTGHKPPPSLPPWIEVSATRVPHERLLWSST